MLLNYATQMLKIFFKVDSRRRVRELRNIWKCPGRLPILIFNLLAAWRQESIHSEVVEKRHFLMTSRAVKELRFPGLETDEN